MTDQKGRSPPSLSNMEILKEFGPTYTTVTPPQRDRLSASTNNPMPKPDRSGSWLNRIPLTI